MEGAIRDLLRQIDELEDKLRTAMHSGQSRVHFSVRGKRVEFEHSIRLMHERARRGIPRWLADAEPRNFATMPVIHGLVPVFRIAGGPDQT
ncbi:MAG: hypothetical protein ABI588_02660 [Arenimonas sp.]